MQKIAKILPLRKMPRSIEVFDYLIPEKLDKDLKIGSIVEVEFKKSKIFGLVIEIANEKPKYKLKEILKIIDKDLIAPYQIKLIKWFSEYYHYSLASTAQLFTPNIPKRKFEQKNEKTEKLKNSGNEELKNNITEKLADKIMSSGEKGYLLFNQNTEMTNNLYLHLIKKHFENNEQILILFPTLSELENFYSTMPDEFCEQALILDSKTYKSSKAKYYEYYQEISENKTKILLGTRSVIFFNLKNTKTIIIDRSEADDYKQWDQNPRYDVNEVLFELIKHVKSKLIVSGYAPKPESYYQSQNNNFKLINLGKNVPETQINRVEFSSGTENYYLTESLDKLIKNGLERNEKILLIVNKRGYASTLKCSDCEKIIECSVCNLPLTVYADSKLFCQHCLKYFNPPTFCPDCQGVNLRAVGIGAMGFENFIQKKYNSLNITVGLPSIHDENFDKFGRAAFVYFDSMFYLPDFSHTAKVFYLLRKSTQRLYSQNPNVEILIQSNFLENHAVAYFNQPIEFYKKELQVRKELKYPPFLNLIKIIARDKIEEKAKQKIQNIYSKISKIKSLDLSAPYPAHSKKIREYYIWQITVKVSDKQAEKELVKMLPDDIIVDKNPINLL